MSRRGLFSTTQTSSISVSSVAAAAGEGLSISSASASVHVERQDSPTVPEMLDSQKLYKGFLDCQKKITELEQQNKVLTAENADLHLRLTSLSRKRGGGKLDVPKKPSESPTSPNSTLIDKVHKIGRHHQLFWCVILDVAQFSRESCPKWPWDDFMTRFSTPEHQKAGPIAELYEVIPAEFHDLMALSTKSDSGKNFVKEFRYAMSQSRSTSLSLLRNNAALIFKDYNLSATHFDAKYTQRDTVPEIRRLLCQSANALTEKLEYPRFPPIICKDEDTLMSTKRFLNPVLFRVARAVIFGKSAIASKTAAVARATSMYLRADKYPQTTIGLVAWVAIMTRYILSKDNCFDQSGVGKETKIQYYVDYDFYKHWLLHAKVKNPRWVDHLFATWDEEIFSHHNKTVRNLPDGEGETVEVINDAEEIARDMEDLNLSIDTFADEIDFQPSIPVTDDNDHDIDDIYATGSEPEVSEQDQIEGGSQQVTHMALQENQAAHAEIAEPEVQPVPLQKRPAVAARLREKTHQIPIQTVPQLLSMEPETVEPTRRTRSSTQSVATPQQETPIAPPTKKKTRGSRKKNMDQS